MLDQGKFAVIPVDMCGAIAMKRSFPTHIIYVARDKEKLSADIIDSDYDTEEKTLRILSIDAEKRNRKICDYVIHNDTIEGERVSGAEEIRRLILLAVALAKKVLPKPIGMLSLALLLGGAVGNFIDRLLFGFVTDMFATTFMNFPVFNVADIGVVVGGVLLCIHVIFTYSKEPKPEEKP